MICAFRVPSLFQLPPYPHFFENLRYFISTEKEISTVFPSSLPPPPPPPAHFIFNLFYRAPCIILNLASYFYLQRIER